MRLKKISWRNFKSYSNILTEIPFTNNASLNLIIGENGTGKSSISEVITYTLYGKIDNIKNSDIPNRINKNFYSKIELDCDGHELIIERGLNPSIFEIHIDGKRIDTAGKTAVQQMIEENYLKIPYSVWINTVMLSINDFKSLISLNAADKRNIIDKIFGFTIYNQLGKLTKDELKGIESLMYETEGSLRTSKENIFQYNKRIDEIKNTTISQEEIDELKSKIQIAEELKTKNETILQKLKDAKIKLNEILLEKGVEVKGIQKRISEIDNKIKLIDLGKCPTCGSSLETDDFRKEKQSLLDEKKICKKHIEDIKNIVLDLKNKSDKIDEKTIQTTQDINTNQLLELKSDLKSKTTLKENNVNPLIELQNKLSKDVEILQEEKHKLEKKKEIYDILLSILIDNNGIKNYIASQYIPVINQLISDMMNYMNLNYVIKFDNSFNSSITCNGYNVNYQTLSTGEKKRIDFACVVSFIKFLKLQMGEINLLFLDELFSNIDINGVTDMMDVLRKLGDELKLNIFLIHHAQLEGVMFDKILQTSKPCGFSQLDIIENGEG